MRMLTCLNSSQITFLFYHGSHLTLNRFIHSAFTAFKLNINIYICMLFKHTFVEEKERCNNKNPELVPYSVSLMLPRLVVDWIPSQHTVYWQRSRVGFGRYTSLSHIPYFGMFMMLCICCLCRLGQFCQWDDDRKQILCGENSVIIK